MAHTPDDIENVCSREIKIPAVDGFDLGATLYQPGSPEAASPGIVIINSATGVNRRYYNSYANFLVSNGFKVVTYDYRGIGSSRPASLRGFKARASDWGKLDAGGVIAWAAREFPNERRLIVGHSIGGLLLGLTGHTDLISRGIFVGAQSGYWKLFDTPQKQAWAFLWYVASPVLVALLGYLPARILGFGADLPGGVASDFGRWCRNPSYVVDAPGGVSRASFARLHAPVLAYSVEDDVTAPRKAVDAILVFFTSALIERRHIIPQDWGLKEFGHFGFFRDRTAAPLWRESVEWLKQT